MKKLIKSLKMREKAAYPSFMRQMQHITTWSDLQEYCESDHVAVHLLGTTGYLIISDKEVVDWVGKPGDVWGAFRIIRRHFGKTPFSMDLREKTSWPVVQLLARRKRVEVVSSSVWIWETETMHEVSLKLI